MARHIPHADQPRLRLLVVGLLAAVLAVAAAVIASAPSLDGGSTGLTPVRSVDYSGYGPGYPLHGGLAGPTPVRSVDYSGYGPGYPLHGGLAGPSRVGNGD
jgi:hypothetical protein